MSRLSKELEQQIIDAAKKYDGHVTNGSAQEISKVVDREVARERDEAIVGAYRAAADKARECGKVMRELGEITRNEKTLGAAVAYEHVYEEILALTTQSALDAVERRDREIAERAAMMQIQMHCHVALYEDGNLTDKCAQCGKDIRDWMHLKGASKIVLAEDVLAKVKRA